jgi:hypothetical protein
MIKLLKSNPLIAFILMPLLAISVWALAFNQGLTVATTGAMPLYDLLIRYVQPQQKLFYCIFSCILVISQAFHLNFVFNRHEVIYKNSWMPSLFYVLLMSMLPQFLVFQPALIANSITIFVIDKIFKLYKNQQPLSLDFDIGFLISISALFYFPSIILGLLFFSGIIILKPFSWRDWIVGFLGFILPFFFMFTYYFLTDQFQYFTSRFFTANIRQEIDVWRLLPKGFGITVGYIVLLLMLALSKLSQNFSKNVIRTRNLQQLMLIFIVVCAIMIVLSPEVQLYRFIILAIPLSFLLAYYFLSANKKWFAELAFWLLIANIVYNFFLMKLFV